jgi:ABC-2 type transport system ATP-binding protein
LLELIDYLKDAKLQYDKIFSERPTLNDVFLELTGKDLRD